MTDGNLAELYKYYDKLYKTIILQANFTIGNLKLVNKQRIDDILCCIDINMPKIFQSYKNKIGLNSKVKHFITHDDLIGTIKVKLPFIKSSYLIDSKKVDILLKKLKTEIIEDFKFIKENYPDL